MIVNTWKVKTLQLFCCILYVFSRPYLWGLIRDDDDDNDMFYVLKHNKLSFLWWEWENLMYLGNLWLEENEEYRSKLYGLDSRLQCIFSELDLQSNKLSLFRVLTTKLQYWLTRRRKTWDKRVELLV